MKDTNDNFNFEEYLEQNEGIFQKFIRWLNAKLDKFFKITILGIKIKWVITVLTIITSLIAIIEFFEKDTGEIIEEIYQQAKSDVTETHKYITMVQLPDSLENTKEVQQLRALQNNILKYHIAYSASITDINAFETNVKHAIKNDSLNKNAVEYIEQSQFILKRAIELGNLSSSINDEFLNAAILFTLGNDLNALSSVSTNEIIKVRIGQKNFVKKLIEIDNQLKLKPKNLYYNIEIMIELFTSKEFRNIYKFIQRSHIGYINAINVRLLNIKNEALMRSSNNKHIQIKTTEKIHSLINR